MAAALGLMRQFNRISSCALPHRLSQIRYLHSERLLHKFGTPRSPLKARTIQQNFQKGKRARGKIKLIIFSGTSLNLNLSACYSDGNLSSQKNVIFTTMHEFYRRIRGVI